MHVHLRPFKTITLFILTSSIVERQCEHLECFEYQLLKLKKGMDGK